MTRSSDHRSSHSAYAGLDFIKAAFCPLEFTAQWFAKHPRYAELGGDEGLADLEVSEPLHYPRQFPYTDRQGHRKTGTQVVSATFGLAPADFDLFLGLFTYLRKLPELPPDGRTHLTLDFIARQCNLPATCAKDYQRLRSRLFRLSYVKYTNSAFWNPHEKEYVIANFGFFNLSSLSRLSVSRRPVALDWDRSLLAILARAPFLTFDYDFYRTLSPALRRFYLIANRDGWNQPHSSLFLAADFAINQIGYSDNPDRSRDRLHKLRRLLREAEALDVIRPFPAWDGYFQTLNQGPRRGELALRWSRGPRLKVRPEEGRQFLDRCENDALYAQVTELKDEDGQPLTLPTYRRLVAQFGRERLQKHVTIVLAQKENRPDSFQRSEVAAFVDRLQHDHPAPDWYQDLQRAERLALLGEVTPSQLSLDMYETFFRG